MVNKIIFSITDPFSLRHDNSSYVNVKKNVNDILA